eukprot:TRINITY_DN16400_c0_g1_i1.p1 TRINITY_DN16400_c0_g1~~TRINITY_DN16400_c0_g1_i1.p1  ORF type:complete len:271 (-),score=47.87 TRINITY_DN16400_c0_g1_i1:318-1130(-)
MAAEEPSSSTLYCRAGVGLPSQENSSASTISSFFSAGFYASPLQRLANGSASFELLDPQSLHSTVPMRLASISSAFQTAADPPPRVRFFARIAPPRGDKRQRSSEAVKKVEHYSVHKVTGDGRCMFRALVVGMAQNKGMSLNPMEEEQESDQLRLAVHEAICGSEKRRRNYEEALIAITLDESLKRYCHRITSHDFWGGESELLVLSRMCQQPISVYIPEAMAKQGARWGSGYIRIQEYGDEYAKSTKDRKGRKTVKLLYNGTNHYDLLV